MADYKPRKKKEQYVPLDTSGNDYASMAGMSDIDRAAYDANKKSWADADARGDAFAKEQAHNAQEALRQKYGFSGGADGSQYIPEDIPKFSYEDAPTYISARQGQIDKLADSILNREKFSYDPESDPMFQRYKELYTRNGQIAMEDTLGKVSARTGGLASSYAGTAAQQAYNNYMDQLNGKIPELERIAYGMYMDEGNKMRGDLDMLMGLEGMDYDRFRDDLNQWNNDRGFAYGAFRDNVGDKRYNKEWDYNVGRDAIEDERYQTEWDYGVSRDQRNDALDKAKTLAAAGDFSGFKALGYTDAEIAALKRQYMLDQAAAAVKGGRRGGGGGDRKGKREDAYFEKHTVDNPTDDFGGDMDERDWVSVPGYGRLTWGELEKLIDSGKVIEEETSDGRHRFRKVDDGERGANSDDDEKNAVDFFKRTTEKLKSLNR